MTEVDRAVEVSDERVAIARSTIERDGAGWKIHIADRRAPYHQRIEGEISVEPLAPPFCPVELTAGAGGLHGWQVLAPRALVRARFERPGFQLEGIGYHDRNHGEERLDDAFARWGWARFHGPRATTVIYSMVERDGRRRALLARASDGDAEVLPIEVAPPPESPTRRTGWGLELPERFGAGALTVSPTSLIEEAPFYARYRARLDGDPAIAAEGIGEHLDCDRFRHRGLQFLLRYKMLGAWRF